jgi:hypothetical protein
MRIWGRNIPGQQNVKSSGLDARIPGCVEKLRELMGLDIMSAQRSKD